MSKEELVQKYFTKRRMNTDNLSDTYRGGMDDYMYVPFSFGDIKNFWKEYIRDNPNREIDFYIHIPFCFSICKYCDYYKLLADRDKINAYLEYLYWYLGEFKNIFENVTFRGLYIGGGSPSLLNEEQIENLLSFIFSNFKFESIGEKTFEINPINLTHSKAKVLEKFGINRISMGIQSVDSDVLDKENRGYQRENSVERAMEILREYSFEDINGDVIMGLKEDSVKSLSNTIEKMKSLGFTSIILYWLLPTDEYLDEHFEGNLEKFQNYLSEKISKYYDCVNFELSKGKDFLEINIKKNNGYRWDLITKNSKLKKYDDFSTASLFGVGASSRSHISSRVYYKFIDSIHLKNSEKEIIHLGRQIDNDLEKALYSITSFTNKEKINLSEYKKLFLSDFKSDNKELIEILINKNMLEEESNTILFNVVFSQKNYYALYFLPSQELQKRIDFLYDNVSIKIKFLNSLMISLKLNVTEKGIKYTIYNCYSINENNIKFLYNFIKELNRIVLKINSSFQFEKGENYYKMRIIKLLLMINKSFIIKNGVWIS